MACDGRTYIPNPPRAWSRVRLDCGYDNLTIVEYYKYLMKKKGNVLQYKKNSACFTRNQIYSKIAQDNWTNRNTTWATQNERGYTNPNNNNLRRDNANNIIISGTGIVETTLPITCPTIPNNNTNVLPNNETGQGDEGSNPVLPPVKSQTGGGGNILPPTPNSDEIEDPIVVQDNGTLICNIIENPCTSFSQTKQANEFYHPTTDSDVPGKIELLYWNDGVQTWYPRYNYSINTSDNKWPNTSGTPEDPTYIAAVAYDNNGNII